MVLLFINCNAYTHYIQIAGPLSLGQPSECSWGARLTRAPRPCHGGQCPGGPPCLREKNGRYVRITTSKKAYPTIKEMLFYVNIIQTCTTVKAWHISIKTDPRTIEKKYLKIIMLLTVHARSPVWESGRQVPLH